MNDTNFEKLDRAFMAAAKGLREEKTGASYGVAAEVERMIRGASAPARSPRRLPWLAPALALSMVLAIPALVPGTVSVPVSGPRFEVASKPSEPSLAEEIAILKEVGAWTEDDDRKVAPDAELEEIELSSAPLAVRTV